MFNISEILEPKTLDQAKEFICKNPNYKIIAGGTDVLIKLRHGEIEDISLISLRNLVTMKEIKLLSDNTISIGAMSSFSDIFRNELISEHLPILQEAAVSMGGPQIRNMATIGGNICNGAVSADSAPSLFALNAKLKLENYNGERIIPISEFYKGPGKVNIKQEEILTEILIEKEDYLDFCGNYIKFANRKAMDIAMLSVAVTTKLDTKKNTVEDLRIALGVAGPTPIRCYEAEIFAKGKTLTEEMIKEASLLALKPSKARDSWRGSKSFREHLIQNLTERAFKESIKRAGGNYFELQ